MASANSTKVPKSMEPVFAELTAITDAFCAAHLDAEYAELARSALAALCRKRPSPVSNGKPQTWACAVIYALGQANFLSDKASTPYMKTAELCAAFDISASTAGNKAKLVRDLLGINLFAHAWTLPSRLATSPTVWMIVYNGFMVNARRLPVEIQQAAVAKGLIPFVVFPSEKAA